MVRLFRRIKPARGTYYLALDIGTEVVKALVCEAEPAQVNQDGTPSSEPPRGHILGFGKVPQRLQDIQNGAVMDISGVITHCEQAIRQAEKMAGVIPDQLIMGIAGELVKGATTVTSYVRKEPDQKIDFDELKNIVYKVQWKAFEQVRAQLAEETGMKEVDVKLVNAAIVDMRIDGYKISNPIGFQGKEIVMSVFNAFAPLVHFGALQTIASELDMDLLAITAEPYAVARCLAPQAGSDLSAIFIDIGGGTTDVAVVRNGIIEGTKMFTIGGRTFTKRLAQELNISFKEAEEIKLAYANKELEKNSEKIIAEAFQSDVDVWLTGVALTLSEFYNVDIFPSKIFLSGGGSLLPEIMHALQDSAWSKKLPFSRKPSVEFLQPKRIKTMIDETKKLNDPQDVTPIALANLALDLAGEERITTSLLKKVMRLMQV